MTLWRLITLRFSSLGLVSPNVFSTGRLTLVAGASFEYAAQAYEARELPHTLPGNEWWTLSESNRVIALFRRALK